MRKLLKAWEILKEEGLRAFLRKTTEAALNLLFEHRVNLLFQKDLKEEVTPYRAKVDVQFSFLIPDEVYLLNRSDLGYEGKSLTLAQDWLAQGVKCLVGRVKGQIVTYLWIGLKERTLAGNYQLPLGKGKAYIFKTFTTPTMRGLGLNPACLTTALQWLRDRGYHTAYIDVNKKNIPSIKAVRKAGFKFAGTFYYIRIVKWWLTFLPSELKRSITQPSVG